MCAGDATTTSNVYKSVEHNVRNDGDQSKHNNFPFRAGFWSAKAGAQGKAISGLK